MREYLDNDVYISRVLYENEVTNISSSQAEIDVKNILSVKNSEWSYEREWRAISPRKGKINLNGNAISCIYFGIDPGKELFDRLKRVAQRNRIITKKIKLNGYDITM
ncbi:hypothetical protein [Azorhizobium caulinodans]|uniref:hypothetical protein n=1 Tax=Azorhizobium caulinodans TaxID=7 RepID=UPI003B75D003